MIKRHIPKPTHTNFNSDLKEYMLQKKVDKEELARLLGICTLTLERHLMVPLSHESKELIKSAIDKLAKQQR